MKKNLALIFILLVSNPCLTKDKGDNLKRDAYIKTIISPDYFSSDSSNILEEKIKESVIGSNINIIPNKQIEEAQKPNLLIEIEVRDSLIISAKSYGYNGSNSYESNYPKKIYKYKGLKKMMALIQSYIKETILKNNWIKKGRIGKKEFYRLLNIYEKNMYSNWI